MNLKLFLLFIKLLLNGILTENLDEFKTLNAIIYKHPLS